MFSPAFSSIPTFIFAFPSVGTIYFAPPFGFISMFVIISSPTPISSVFWFVLSVPSFVPFTIIVYFPFSFIVKLTSPSPIVVVSASIFSPLLFFISILYLSNFSLFVSFTPTITVPFPSPFSSVPSSLYSFVSNIGVTPFTSPFFTTSPVSLSTTTSYFFTSTVIVF